MVRVVLASVVTMALAVARPARAAEPFLQGLGSSSAPTDSGVDSVGNTYLVGSNGSIRKFEPSGLEIKTPDWHGRSNTTSSSPTSLHVGADGYLYVTLARSVIKYRQDNGDQVASWSTTGSVYLRDCFVQGSVLYTCGSFSSTTNQTIGTKTATAFGPSASLLIKLDSSLSSTSAQALKTWGFDGYDRANSVVVDQSGSVYVAGVISAGTFAMNTRGVTGVSATINGNQGYVVKWNSGLTSASKFYVTSANENGHVPHGGETTELYYSQGWVYAIGSWAGLGNAGGITPTDDTFTHFVTDIQLLKLDTELVLNARATVKGSPYLAGLSVSADQSGNIYMTGTYGPGSVDLIGASDRATSGKFQSISSPNSSLFVAKLNSSCNFQWVQFPSSTVSTTLSRTTRVRWNPIIQRLVWFGSIVSGSSMTMGNPGSELSPPLSGGQGFLAVFEPNGDMTERVRLTVISQYGTSGTQIKPFGGPGPDVKDGLNSQKVIKNSTITASVPSVLYRDVLGNDITGAVASDQDAQTRIRVTGYSVDDNVSTGQAESYSFTLDHDTTVTFNWVVEHSLTIASDLSGTVGQGDPVHLIAGLPGLTSEASGNPDPPVKKSWIGENESVIAAIDGDVMDLSDPSLPVKYSVIGYLASGPPNKNALNKTNAQFYTFPAGETRQQVPEFFMDGPASITYVWKLKIGVQVNTTGPASAALPRIHVVGDSPTTPPTQPDGIGTGTFFYNEHTVLEIGSAEQKGLQQLKGWFNGDGFVIPSQGNKDDLGSSFVISNAPIDTPTNFLSHKVLDLVRPAKVMWDYGDRIFTETVAIGNSVTFSAVFDPVVKAQIRRDLPPASVDIVEGPQGSSGDDMGIWDDVANKYFPLRPGKVTLSWRTTDPDPNSRIIVNVTIVYPTAPHYRHIANTPAVPLDPDPNDLVEFKELKYSENDAQIDSSNRFSAFNPGHTVLLFGEISSIGRSGQAETLRVRVVQTHNWNESLPTASAVIGQQVTSSYDTAGLETGYIFRDKAPYNVRLHDRASVTGPIFPVNINPTGDPNKQLIVVWYERRDQILWPYQAVRYTPVWPTEATGLERIVMASRYGSDSVSSNGTDQVVAPATTVPLVDSSGAVIGATNLPPAVSFAPARFQQLQVYHQPDSALAGYNPNEEHALIAPSLRYVSISPRPNAVYALRDNDLNVTNRDSTYTSDPYVLAQYFDVLLNHYGMKVYKVVREDSNLNLGDLSYNYTFQQTMTAGEPVIPFYPLPTVIGATRCPGTYGRDGDPAHQIVFWKDHKDTGWAISGDGKFYMYFFYPLIPDFWWPPADGKNPGDCVAWLPDSPGFSSEVFGIDYRRNDQAPPAQAVQYNTVWPEDVPIVKVGETLTFPGGEYREDNPTTLVSTDDGGVRTVDTPGLPGVVGWAAGQIVFDTLNPTMDDQVVFDHFTARLFPALEERTVSLSKDDFPSGLLPANQRSKVKDGNYVFTELSASLQKRVFYDPIRGELGMVGFLNDKGIGDPTLTASPPAVYVLEANVMTRTEADELASLAPTSQHWTDAVDALYKLSRNPNLLDKDGNGTADDTFAPGLGKADQAYRVGVEQKIVRHADGSAVMQTNDFGIESVVRDDTKGAPLVALGPGLALVTNPDFLDPLAGTPPVSYVTVAENNSDALGGSPVVLHVIKVVKNLRYRGAIKTILSDNVFDENIILRHTGDFGGNADSLVFEWWYRPEDGTEALTPDVQPSPNPWKLFSDPSGKQGRGYFQIKVKGNPSAPEVLLADSLFFVRYRHTNDVHTGVDWNVTQPDGSPTIPYQWAGAGNSSPNDVDGDGLPDYKPQLAQGWVKRVLDAVNPYEARIREFEGDNPATYSSMIQELGAPYAGPVALNPDKNVIENVGLIELYQTILNRARDLSIDLSTPISTPGIANALELASTRLADFYALLGNEAYADAENPTIGFGSDSVEYGNRALGIFAFENQVASLMDEELALLRGVDYDFGRPVYNRLFWNFTKDQGEVAYAMNYNIRDMNNDGFIDENDAMILYPQGHGDAWGYYLSALTAQYDLLRHPNFEWVSRSELYNLQDIVIPVDFLDERKFAQIAAAKAKAGAEIVDLTYRSKYVEDPAGQWQGYTDTEPSRSWGVQGWARRAGQGALFDWVTANALLPSRHPNTNYTGIQKIDRSTVKDIAVISANLVAIQQRFDEANSGNNPLGLSGNVVPFDINPSLLDRIDFPEGGISHFEQIYNRAVNAVNNAKALFDSANQANNMVRQVANSEEDFRRSVFEQDLSYRNRLIEIFGSPYDGNIGSGRAYPPGYLGPDTMLYMYVDVREITKATVPQPSVTFTNGFIAALTDSSGRFDTEISNDFRKRHSATFSGNNPSDFFANFNNNAAVNYTDTSNLKVALLNLNIPVAAAGYTFQAPPEWGQRSSPGELQLIISRMVQAEADLARAIADWDGKQGEILRAIYLINARYDMDRSIRTALIAQIAVDKVLDATALGFKIGAGVAEIISEAIDDAALAGSEAIPQNTPIGGLAVGPGDVLAPVRSAIQIARIPTKAGFKANQIILEKLADTTDFLKSIADSIVEIENDRQEREYGLKEQLTELENLVGDEAPFRLEVFHRQEALRELSDQYRAKLQEGIRLIQERTAFNQKVAAITQQHRYQDMTFRVARNGSLEKYRSAFNLAARYAYLAAKAYDYETNLDPDDPASPFGTFSDIIRARSLGFMVDGEPQFGGGVAGSLAWLKANFEGLKGQLGLINRQSEFGKFSLRNEAFRTMNGPISDLTWRTFLLDPAHYKDDLWQVPEFRRYCRPFAPETNGPQPGLVIPFSTQIIAGQNFFGWPLGGADHAYDPSVFATKIRSVGVWFTGYDNTQLSQTPRVYLIPVGIDVMTIPTSRDLEIRPWNVLDQSIPAPLANISAGLNDPAWIPASDSLAEPFGITRRFSSFRAYGDTGPDANEDEMSFDTRLAGRSVWNTRWLLIIPGIALHADPVNGLQTFINGNLVDPNDPTGPRDGMGVSDIKLFFDTYGYSGN